MKKIISAVLAVALSAMLFTACAPVDPKTALVKATEKTADLKDTDITIDMAMSMDMMGMKMEMPIKGNFLITNKEDKIEFYSTMNMELMGQKLDVGAYYSDGFMYTSAMGQKVKMAMDVEQAMKASMSAAPIEIDMIKEVTTEKVEAGTKYLITIDETKMNEYLAKILGGAMGSAGMDLSTMELSNLKDYYMIVNNEGYTVGQGLSCDMTMKIDLGQGESEVKTNMVLEMVYNNPGKPVVITAPTDLDVYVEGTVPTV